MAVKHPCRQNIWNTENKIFGTQKIKYFEHKKSNTVFGTQKIKYLEHRKSINQSTCTIGELYRGGLYREQFYRSRETCCNQ